MSVLIPVQPLVLVCRRLTRSFLSLVPKYPRKGTKAAKAAKSAKAAKATKPLKVFCYVSSLEPILNYLFTDTLYVLSVLDQRATMG